MTDEPKASKKPKPEFTKAQQERIKEMARGA